MRRRPQPLQQGGLAFERSESEGGERKGMRWKREKKDGGRRGAGEEESWGSNGGGGVGGGGGGD